mmetsp:Transcript_34277/g.101795  ORF Transcript_34277/g.101795 Transcript_34277/m.101795 type:complete len:310 (-) Transcript_34277:140-1069(-)
MYYYTPLACIHRLAPVARRCDGRAASPPPAAQRGGRAQGIYGLARGWKSSSQVRLTKPSSGSRVAVLLLPARGEARQARCSEVAAPRARCSERTEDQRRISRCSIRAARCWERSNRGAASVAAACQSPKSRSKKVDTSAVPTRAGLARRDSQKRCSPTTRRTFSVWLRSMEGSLRGRGGSASDSGGLIWRASASNSEKRWVTSQERPGRCRHTSRTRYHRTPFDSRFRQSTPITRTSNSHAPLREGSGAAAGEAARAACAMSCESYVPARDRRASLSSSESRSTVGASSSDVREVEGLSYGLARARGVI